MAFLAAMVSWADPVPHPSGCPNENTWLLWNQMPWDSVITYDQCYSSQLNWPPHSYPDYRIVDPGTPPNRPPSGISMQFSTALAWAVASVKVGTKEFIASGGHGAAFQYAIHPTVPSQDNCPPNTSCTKSECWNPTEAGNKTDDNRNMAGSNTAAYKAQMHGPSTSAILDSPNDDQNQSGTHSQPTTHQWFRSHNRMAYFIPNGATGFGNCTAHYPPGSPHSLGLSHYILDKEVRLGAVKAVGAQQELAGAFPIIAFNANLTIEEESSPDFDTVQIAYLRDEFNTFWRLLPACPPGQSGVCVQSVTPGASSTDPYIVSNGAGGDSYAIGLFAVPPVGSGTHAAPQYWLASSTNPTYRTLQVTFYSINVSPGTLNYKSYWVVGSLDWVKGVLRELQNHPNIAW